MTHTLLCVDDESDNVDALERLFRKNFKVLKALSGQEALNLLKSNQVTVIISDQRMPEMSGVEFLTLSQKTHPEAIRILLTGYTDIQSVIEAINSGQIYRYVTKPWDPQDLTTAVQRAVERFELQTELKTRNQELKKAYEELQSLDQAKMHFMYLVNHELKTPLTAILSFGELLNETKLDDDQSIYLNRILKSSIRLKKIIEDVLVVVSAETGQLKTSKEIVGLKDLIYPLLPETEGLLEKRRLKISDNLTESKILTDQKLLRDVFQRLLNNAAKFATEDSQIEVTLERTSSEDIVTLTNLGSEIPKDKLKKLMEPFTLNEDFMNHTAGTGLGLAVCHAITKALGATLEVESSAQKICVRLSLKRKSSATTAV